MGLTSGCGWPDWRAWFGPGARGADSARVGQYHRPGAAHGPASAGAETVATLERAGLRSLSTEAGPTLFKAMARAHRWQRLLDDGRYASISELAAAEKIERGFFGKMLQLTRLAPDIVERLMAGQHETDTLSLTRLPVLWTVQTAALAIG